VDSYKDDTGEAVYPEINLVKSSNMDTQIDEGFSTTPNRRARYEVALTTRRMTYVHCWFKGEPDNEYMWNKYGDEGKGICIQGSSDRLKLNIFFNHSEFIGNVGECVYCDPDEPIPTSVSWFPAIRKNKQRFDMEQEIRFLIRYDISKLKQGTNLDELPTFQKLAVNLNGLIDSIYFGPKMKESERESILQSIRDSGLIVKLKLLR
jgi:Protein of unknown function (DUF2971)